MLEIINRSNDPYFNLALEDYLLNRGDIKEDIFLLWQNSPVVVVGRNQNTVEEINQSFIQEKGIEVVRRISGGGAVYHDLGNLNFTFIVNDAPSLTLDFTRFTAPVIKALETIGVKAEDQGRNDISIKGRKFSGNAQCRQQGRLMHHGTILFDTNLEDMEQALTVDSAKISSKGVKSVRSRVTNITEHISSPVSIEEFQDILSSTIDKNRECRELSPSELSIVESLRDNKFRRWEWIYGFSPPFNVRKSQRFDWGSIDFRINVIKGLITDCKIYGDFFATGDISIIEQQLIGVRYRDEDLRQVLEHINLAAYFPSAYVKDIIELIRK
ncbi:MAG: lipoate--protein ligase [Syntrophomonadaceae bacterium]|nr:lipoate--protein ligase [Syntrophomonadaceae bacterium]